MKDIDEQMEEVLHRADMIKQEKADRSVRLYKVLAVCAGLAIVITAALLMPVLSGTVSPDDKTVYGSIMLGSPYLAYILIAVLAFVLGMSVAILCMHIEKGKKAEP